MSAVTCNNIDFPIFFSVCGLMFAFENGNNGNPVLFWKLLLESFPWIIIFLRTVILLFINYEENAYDKIFTFILS